MAAFSSHGHTHTHTNTPVVEVHDSLDGAAPSSVNVSFKAWQQRCHHVHSVPFTLPVKWKNRQRTDTITTHWQNIYGKPELESERTPRMEEVYFPTYQMTA